MTELKRYIDSLINEGIPYIDVIATKDGKELVRYYNGRGDVTGKEKLFLFSCTKPLTVTLAMNLIEKGLLSLDEPLEDIIPSFRDVFLVENGVKRPPKTKITVRHLFTMSAGLSYKIGMYPAESAYLSRGDKSPALAIAESFAKGALISEPGEKFIYSLCHDTLAAIIELRSGMRFSECMKKYIWEPLGMSDTRFGNRHEDDVAELYFAYDSGKITPMKKENILIYADGYESGGAGLISTVEDYSKFTAALSLGGIGANGKRILSESSVRALYTPEIPLLAEDNGFTHVREQEYYYGLGVRTRTKPTEWGLPVGEFGWDGAAGSYLSVDPVNKISVFIGMHMRGWTKIFKDKHLEIVKHIYRIAGIKP